MKPVIHVETFKQGLLSRLGHDLRLQATRFELELERGTLKGRVELASLHVLGALHDGRVDAATPGDGDKRQIEASMRDDVLETERYPEASLRADVSSAGLDRFSVRGTLELHGRSEPIALTAERRGDVLRAELELSPSRFGVKPFKALGGALKIQDRVRVIVELPVAAITPSLTDLASASARWTEGA